MKRIDYLTIILLLPSYFSFNGCFDEGNGYDTDLSGLKYKYIEQSANIETINPGDFIEMELQYWNDVDSLLFNSKEINTPFRMQVKPLSHQGGSFENALMIVNPGDRIKFTLPADSFYLKTLRKTLPKGVKKGTALTLDLKVIKKLQAEELEKEQEIFISQLKEKESEFIDNYVSENEIKVQPSFTGLYFIKIKEGNGKKAKPGCILSVHYVGKFLDETVFDSSYSRREPFDFELGALQVTDGWEEACKQMKEGDKVKLIIPSALAYGKEGYGDLIPPYCPLIFEIELIAVN